MGVPNDDSRWGNCYGNIRATNHMFERAVSSYTGNLADIKKELAEGHFFRAYNYFYLLKFFGGVPVVTKVLDVTSPELYGKRNSRYEVVNLILSDLDEAIAGLPLEQNITSADKGKISKQAAQAFKARVLLYEATWRKYNGTSTDFEGTAPMRSVPSSAEKRSDITDLPTSANFRRNDESLRRFQYQLRSQKFRTQRIFQSAWPNLQRKEF